MENTAGVESLPVRIANEFAEVTVESVRYGHGRRLKITASAKAGRQVLLDPIILEALTAVSPDQLTEILVSTVYGNQDDRLRTERSIGR